MEPVLHEKQQLAIQLKYEGKTYEDIAEVTGNNKGTIKDWFAVSGPLYIPYLKYAATQYKAIENEAQGVFKKHVGKMVDLMIGEVTWLQKRLHRKEALLAKLNPDSLDKKEMESYDLLEEEVIKLHGRIAYKAGIILDRAGLSIIRKLDMKTDDSKTERPDSFEQFVTDSKGAGIDPISGLPQKAQQMVQN